MAASHDLFEHLKHRLERRRLWEIQTLHVLLEQDGTYRCLDFNLAAASKEEILEQIRKAYLATDKNAIPPYAPEADWLRLDSYMQRVGNGILCHERFRIALGGRSIDVAVTKAE